ncbi:MAG: DUF6686 family protein [Bacteroidota bacterium]
MCHYSQHIFLAETFNAQITWCKVCQSYSMVYNNCALSFNQRELVQFKKMLGKLTCQDYNYSLMGEQKVMIKNQKSAMGVCFSADEVEELKSLISEALTMNEVYGIIYT